MPWGAHTDTASHKGYPVTSAAAVDTLSLRPWSTAPTVPAVLPRPWTPPPVSWLTWSMVSCGALCTDSVDADDVASDSDSDSGSDLEV